jgi:hypothetical protein
MSVETTPGDDVQTVAASPPEGAAEQTPHRAPEAPVEIVQQVLPPPPEPPPPTRPADTVARTPPPADRGPSAERLESRPPSEPAPAPTSNAPAHLPMTAASASVIGPLASRRRTVTVVGQRRR